MYVFRLMTSHNLTHGLGVSAYRFYFICSTILYRRRKYYGEVVEGDEKWSVFTSLDPR